MTGKNSKTLLQRWKQWRTKHEETISLVGWIGTIIGIVLVPLTLYSAIHPVEVNPIIVIQTVHDIERVPSATITITTSATVTVTRATTTTTTQTLPSSPTSIPPG